MCFMSELMSKYIQNRSPYFSEQDKLCNIVTSAKQVRLHQQNYWGFGTAKTLQAQHRWAGGVHILHFKIRNELQYKGRNSKEGFY